MGLPVVGAAAPLTNPLPVACRQITQSNCYPRQPSNSSCRSIANSIQDDNNSTKNQNSADVDDNYLVAAFDVNRRPVHNTNIFFSHHHHQQQQLDSHDHHQFNSIESAPTHQHQQQQPNSSTSKRQRQMAGDQLYNLTAGYTYECPGACDASRQSRPQSTCDCGTNKMMCKTESPDYNFCNQQGVTCNASIASNSPGSSLRTSVDPRYGHDEFQQSLYNNNNHHHNHQQQIFHHHQQQQQQQISINAQNQLMRISSTGGDDKIAYNYEQDSSNSNNFSTTTFTHFNQVNLVEPKFDTSHSSPPIDNHLKSYVGRQLTPEMHKLNTNESNDLNNNSTLTNPNYSTFAPHLPSGCLMVSTNIQESYCDQSMTMANENQTQQFENRDFYRDSSYQGVGHHNQQPQYQQDIDYNNRQEDCKSNSFEHREVIEHTIPVQQHSSTLPVYKHQQQSEQQLGPCYSHDNQTAGGSAQNDNYRHLFQLTETFSDNNQQAFENQCLPSDDQSNHKLVSNHEYSSQRQTTNQDSVDGTTNHTCQVSTTTATSTLDGSSLPNTVSNRHDAKGKRGRPRKKSSRGKHKANGKLWEFIRDLLLSERTNPSFIRWERREDGVFKFVQSDKVAKMWGERKQNPKMTYEKLSRAMRYYYKSKVLLPVFGRRLVYKFGPNATGWLKMIE